jgi:hypothetical protein
MKVLTVLALALAPLAAHADPLLDNSAQLIGSIQQQLTYLTAHVDDCTSYGSSIKSMMLAPLNKDAVDFRARMSHFELTGPNACTSSADLDHILAELNSKLTLSVTPQSQLFSMTPDQAIAKALVWDSGHPACAAQNPNDPSSTDQMKAYLVLKTKLTQLKVVMTGLKKETDCTPR